MKFVVPQKFQFFQNILTTNFKKRHFQGPFLINKNLAKTNIKKKIMKKIFENFRKKENTTFYQNFRKKWRKRYSVSDTPFYQNIFQKI